MTRLNSAQKIIMNRWKGEHVHIELNNKEKHEDILVKDVDPYHMIFLLELPGGDELIPMKSIFRMKNRNGDELTPGKMGNESHTKQYGSIS